MSPRTNAASLDEHDDQTEPDTNITAIRAAIRPPSGPSRWQKGLVPAPVPAPRSSVSAEAASPTRTSQIHVSPRRVTPPPPVPRASMSPRTLGGKAGARRPSPSPLALAPRESPPKTEPVVVARALAEPTRPRILHALAPAHSEQRWSAPPVLLAPSTTTRGEPTLELAARESRHSFAPPDVSDSAARFLPWYWRAWLALLARLDVVPL